MGDRLASELQRHIQTQLRLSLHLVAWPEQSQLPAYLATQYRFLEGQGLGKSVLFALSPSSKTVREMKAHQIAIQRYSALPLVFVLDRITPGTRRSLIAAGIPFVVPGTQLYLPFLGVSLQERFRGAVPGVRRLSPSAQVMLLYVLLQEDWGQSTPTEMAGILGYTSMAMVRALDQLEAASLVESARVDRQRVFNLIGSRREVWDLAQAYLNTPVAKRVRISAETEMVRLAGQLSGISGLAHYSSLAPTGIPVRALSPEEFSRLDVECAVIPVEEAEEAGTELEVWKYSPRLLSQGEAVDRLSLYLDMREDEDERVQSALTELMEGVTW